MNKALLRETALATTTLTTSEFSHSRTMGHYASGVVGVRDLVVPPSPGFFYAQYNAFYEADRYVDGDGNKRLTVESEGGELKLDTDVDVMATAPVFLRATFSRWLGADYAFLKCLNAI